MEVLRVYGLIVNLKQILGNYWYEQRLVLRSGKYYSRLLHMGQGVTYGYPVTPTTFNIVVDAVVWEKLREVCGPQEPLNRMGWAAGDQDTVIYTDYDRIPVRNPI